MEQHIELLIKAQQEINQLRRTNEVLSAKVKTYDEMMLLFNTSPIRGGVCMGMDINWEIDQFLKEQPDENDKK